MHLKNCYDYVMKNSDLLNSWTFPGLRQEIGKSPTFASQGGAEVEVPDFCQPGRCQGGITRLFPARKVPRWNYPEFSQFPGPVGTMPTIMST